eukprot:scaffold27073_cov135-Skeletonema_menzelii.AAC.1
MPITQTHKKCDNNNKDDGEVAVASSKATAIVMATATNKEKEDGNGKKPSPHLDAHEQVGGVSGSSSIMRNPYLPHHFQAYSYSPFLSSDGQLHCSPLRHFDPPPPKKKKQKHSNDLVRTPLPLLLPTSTYSPVRNKFGNDYYISPTRSTPAPAALYSKKDPPQLLPPPAVAAAEEAKKKTKGDGGGGDYVTVSFPTAFPKLAVKAKGKRAHRSRSDDDAATNEVTLTSWDRKFDELQRQEHTKLEDGKTSALTDERLERLESIGFDWAKRKGQVGWDTKYEELLQYKAKFGNCHVPTKFKENTALGRWVSQQRAEYKKFCKGEKSSLTTERIIRLNSIGFAWWFLL